MMPEFNPNMEVRQLLVKLREIQIKCTKGGVTTDMMLNLNKAEDGLVDFLRQTEAEKRKSSQPATPQARPLIDWNYPETGQTRG